MHDSLYRNSIYLLINLGVTSIAGFLFVIISTHFYSQRELGYATALIGALGLATALSNIGMNRTIVRFLGKSDTKSQDLVTKLVLSGLVSVLVGIALSLFFKSFGIKHASIVTGVIFTSAVLLMSVKSIFDTVFVATRTASGTLIENAAFSLVKLLSPLFLVSFGFIGIFSSQLFGALVAVIVSVLLLQYVNGIKISAKPSRTSMNGKWRFALGSYTSDLIGGLPTSVLPIIVVARLGAVDGALWYAAMQIINFLITVSSSINQAMFAEMANATSGINIFIKKASIAMYGLLVPLSILIFLFASSILKLFGHDYAPASHVLKLMTIFALIGIANYISGSILGLYKKVFYLTLVNAANAIVVVMYCLTLAHNLTGIAVGWMLGEVVNVVLFVGGCIYFMKKANISLAP